MNGPSGAMSQAPLDSTAAPAISFATRPWYWSVRRELWEHRSIYLAPLFAAALVLTGYLIGTLVIPRHIRALAALEPMRQQAALQQPFGFAAVMIVLVMFLVAVYYCIVALHGERRDRSILFWKSLPVSDLTTVLSKASVPFLVLPLIAFTITVLTQFTMLLMGSVGLQINGMNASMLWSQLPVTQMPVVLFYGMTVATLWYAPVYGWLLLVSCWSRRASFLWALSPLAICFIERIAFNSGHFASLLLYRAIGFFNLAFAATPRAGSARGTLLQLSQLDPGRFFRSGGLWVGLAVAAGLLAAAVRLRRHRVPE